MIRLNASAANGWASPYRLPQRKESLPPKTAVYDTVQFGARRPRLAFNTATYPPRREIGTYSPPKSHMYYDTFDPAGRAVPNPPGVATIQKIVSLDPSTVDPKQAYASEVTVSLKGTRLAGNTVPGEHLTFLDISDSQVADDTLKAALKAQGPAYRFTPQNLQALSAARLKNFTIASPLGGERDWKGKPNGTVKLIVRRVEHHGVKGPMTNYIVSRQAGDPLVFVAPISHHFLGPTAKTPAVFIGVGSSVSPYVSMLKTRFEQEVGPYAETYLAIGHTRQSLEYYGDLLRKYAGKEKHHFTYRPVFSRESDKSNGVAYVQSLLQKEEEAKKLFKLILNPKSHIYVSGFFGFDQQIVDALKQSAQKNSRLNVSPERLEEALEKARAEHRFHVEGEVRQDLAEGLQGY